MGTQPNILLIMTDQFTCRALSMYGNRIVQTPVLDNLAARSTVFDNCWCNNPLCVPSRASMLSGRLSSHIHSYDNGSEFPAAIPTFLHEFRLHGYRTVLSGKMHFVGPDQLHGFESRCTPDIYPSSFDWTPDWSLGEYGNPGCSFEKLHRSGPCEDNEQLQYDRRVLRGALQQLDAFARSPDKPFFLCTSFTHPHDPFLITREYWDLYADAEIDMPKTPPVPLEELHPYNRWIQIHHMADQFPPSAEHIRNSRRAYYGMASFIDRCTGELLERLKATGLADNTIVLFTSDHGEMLGEHGMFFKRTYLEPSARVPLLIHHPGAKTTERVNAVVSLVDLFPTLLSLAGLPPATTALDGADFSSLLINPDAEWKNEAVLEYMGEGALAPMRTVRQGRYKLVHVPGTPDQLFDLETDPEERTNGSGDPALAKVEAGLRKRLMQDWEPEKLAQQIRISQQERLYLAKSNNTGRVKNWVEPSEIA